MDRRRRKVAFPSRAPLCESEPRCKGMTDNGVRQLIRQRLQAGWLPRERTIELWVGPGFGQLCDGCVSPITTSDRMWLMCADDWQAVRLHAECFALWEAEKRTARYRERGATMQVDCWKCSKPIALTDIIESSGGRLSHVDCRRPNVLTAEERALLFVYCAGHAVAHCLGCDIRFRMAELASDMLGGRTNLCPRCRRDLTKSVRAHLYGCAMLP